MLYTRMESTVIKCFGSTAGPELTLAMNTTHFAQDMAIDTRGYMLVADESNNIIIDGIWW